MSWSELIQNRIRSWTSTEYVLSVAYLATLFVLAWYGRLSTEYVAGAGPVMTFIWGRTRQKGA